MILWFYDSMNWLWSTSEEKEEAMGTGSCTRASRIPDNHKVSNILSCSSKRTSTRSWQVIVSFCLALVGPE